jgi:hypothetical protein
MPDDTSPHGGEAMHELPDRARIPKDKPGTRPAAGIDERPPLPQHPEPMAADIEDEEEDPVVESGPGVADETGKPSVTRQPGG